MKKINDDELNSMIESGKSQKECADYFMVSPSAINQRIKKLESYKIPDSFKNLTSKKQAFVLAKVERKSNMEAVKSAYDVSSNESAKSIGCNLMKESEVNIAIRDLMAQEGIGRRRRVQRLRDLILSNDLSVVAKGLDMANKLTGEYAPLQVDMTLTDEMIVKWIDCAVEMAKANVIEIEESKTDKN